MHQSMSRALVLAVDDTRQEIASMMARARPRVRDYGETVALYLLVSAFWGLIFYVAATALP